MSREILSLCRLFVLRVPLYRTAIRCSSEG
jgi:hypothetical protein